MAEIRTHRGHIRPVLNILITVLAMLAVTASGAPPEVKGVLLIIVAVAGWRALMRRPAHVIRLEPAAGSSLDGVRGTVFATAVSGLFVALGVTPVAGRTRRVFIFRDELDPEAFRTLLAFLRHG